jgi:hypothetical protein
MMLSCLIRVLDRIMKDWIVHSWDANKRMDIHGVPKGAMLERYFYGSLRHLGSFFGSYS